MYMRERALHRILSGQQAPVAYVHSIIGLQNGCVQAKEVLTRFVNEDGQMTTVGALLEDLSLEAEPKVQLDLPGPPDRPAPRARRAPSTCRSSPC